MRAGFLLAASGDVDFMIHGLFKYRLFGQEFWITTTHVSILVVMLVLFVFALAANRAMRHAQEVPGFFQNIVEMIVLPFVRYADDSMIFCREEYGKLCEEISQLHRIDLYLYFCQQYLRSVWASASDSRLWRDTSTGNYHILYHTVQQCEVQQVRCIYRSV